MKREEIIRRLELKFPGLKVIKPIGKVYLLVEDCYGIMKIRGSYINSGWKPSIQTAVDKTEYFKNRLKEIQPDLVVLSEYIGFPKKILVKTNLDKTTLNAEVKDVLQSVGYNYQFVINEN